jgi:hypothetical protein
MPKARPQIQRFCRFEDNLHFFAMQYFEPESMANSDLKSDGP